MQNSKHENVPDGTPPGCAITIIRTEACHIAQARRLDMLADAELQHGHHFRAEKLAWRAAEIREGAQ